MVTMLRTALALLLASASLHQAAAQEAMRPPSLVNRNWSPLEAAALEKRDTCPDGGQCFIGSCCGDGCASNCCGHDQGGVGCGITEKCSFRGNVFIGCCPIVAIGGCTGTATRVTIHTPFRTVTFGAETTSATTTSTEQSFSLPTAPATTRSMRTTDASSEGSFSLPTASRTGRTTTETSADSTNASTPSGTTDTETTATSTPAASSAVATTTSAGRAPVVTAFAPGGVNIGAMAVFGAWMAL